jgi:hypothetical protein
MPYSYLTFSSAVSILASRLQDPGQIYWSQPSELLNCLIESVRLFNTLTGSYKQKIAFQTTPGVGYYDLPNITDPAAANIASIAYTVTDVEVANNVLASLLEPPLTSGTWAGTGQFSLSQLQSALQNRLNRFIGETGCRVTQLGVPGPSPPTDIAPLPDGAYDVRRVAWQPPAGSPPTTPPRLGYPLGRMDEWSEQAYLPAAAQGPTQPYSYSVFGIAPVQIRMIPPPLNPGMMDSLLVLAGPSVNLNPSAPVVLGIPDDLSASLKWGVLADLLGTDGPSRDYARAAYCEQRYQEFVSLARIYPSALTADINNITAGIGSVADLDAYQPDWQQSTGQPGFIGMCGRNLACIGLTPDDGTAAGNPGSNYGIGLWMTANAPVSPAGYLQVGRDQIDPVLDYAQHIASFKMGGAEFDGTTRLFQNLIACAKSQNGRLDAVAFYRSQQQQPAFKSEIEIARMIA